MVKKTTPTKTKSILTSWFLTQPFKFALLSFALLIVLSVAYALIAVAITGGQSPLATWPIAVLMSVTFIYCVYKLIKWLPVQQMDHRGFVAIDNGLTLIYYVFSILSLIFLIKHADTIMVYLWAMQNSSITLFWIVMTISALLYLYVFGLMLANVIAIYRRAVTMGVPKWKIIMSLPFTFAIYWFPGYILPDEKKPNNDVTIKSKWYNALTDWVVARPVNAVLIFLLTIVVTALFFDLYTLTLTVILAIIFGLWVWISGVKTFQKKIGGAFATFIASMNIALVLLFLGFLCFAPHVFMTDAMQATQYQVVDSAPMMDVQYNNF